MKHEKSIKRNGWVRVIKVILIIIGVGVAIIVGAMVYESLRIGRYEKVYQQSGSELDQMRLALVILDANDVGKTKEYLPGALMLPDFITLADQEAGSVLRGPYKDYDGWILRQIAVVELLFAYLNEQEIRDCFHNNYSWLMQEESINGVLLAFQYQFIHRTEGELVLRLLNDALPDEPVLIEKNLQVIKERMFNFYMQAELLRVMGKKAQAEEIRVEAERLNRIYQHLS